MRRDAAEHKGACCELIAGEGEGEEGRNTEGGVGDRLQGGNLTSVVKALQFAGAETLVTQSARRRGRAADKIVLPGVGHFQSTDS